VAEVSAVGRVDETVSIRRLVVGEAAEVEAADPEAASDFVDVGVVFVPPFRDLVVT
jgi:hypothetical protein